MIVGNMMLGAVFCGFAPYAVAVSKDAGRAVAVSQGAWRVAGQDIVQAAQALVRARFAHVPGRLDLRVLRVPDAVTQAGAEGAVTLVPEFVALNGQSSTIRVHVRLRVDGRDVRVVPVTFDARMMRPGTVATRALMPGEVLVASDMRAGEVNALVDPENNAVSPAALVGLRVRQRVPKSAALTPLMLEVLPEVRRGGHVSVELSEGGVAVRASGVAMADAAVGHRTRVRLWHDEIVTATVVDVGRVQLDGGTRR